MKYLYAALSAVAISWVAATCASCVSVVRLLPVRLQAERAVEIGVACAAVAGGKPTLQLGSGVIVDSRHVVTAFHVVSCQVMGAVAVLSDGRQLQVKVDRAAVSADVARLVLSEPVDVPAVEIAPPPGPKSRVCMESANPVRRRLCGLEMLWIRADGQEIKFAASPVPGNSGSGLWDARGRLIGIVTHRGHDGSFGLATALSPRRWLFSNRL